MTIIIDFSKLASVPVPGVPAVAGWAPGSTRQPPGLECLAATAAAMVELHTDCFHIMSQFCTMSIRKIVMWFLTSFKLHSL